MVHYLNIYPKFKPVEVKYCAFNVEHYMVINTVVEKLLKVGFIREFQYPK